MKTNRTQLDRRDFLRAVGCTAFGAAMATGTLPGRAGENAASPAFPQVPTRKLGKTGLEIPALGLGCLADFTKLHNILDTALQYGLFYWDTATNYSRTRSQTGIGQYLEQHPEVRKKLLLLSKPVDIDTPLPVIADFEKDLQESLERAQTDYFDVYLAVHALTNPAQLNDELKAWSEDCKRRGLFRFVGFSAHANVPEALQAAAKCGWIDVALVSANFQLLQSDEYQRAVDAAAQADIGLIGMKTQRRMTISLSEIETEAGRKLAEHFLGQGFTEGQAKLKFVLEDKRFSSAVVGMSDLGILHQNVAVALDKTTLGSADLAALRDYAEATCSGYCGGCSHLCHAAVPEVPYVADVMRYMMYYNSYGHRERARELFGEIPADVRTRLPHTDYSRAEAVCPNRIPIGKVMTEAAGKLA